LLLVLLLCGCAAPRQSAKDDWRPFAFGQDTFAYANELVWEYEFDSATGKTTHRPRQPPPSYTHHCFVMARAARQFFLHARFEPRLPIAQPATYRRLIRLVLDRSPRRPVTEDKRIVIPGYAGLHDFSQAHEGLLKAEGGGAWQSYFQRGHWRVVLPFSRAHQERIAEQLRRAVRDHRVPVAHLVRFPSLAINHAVALFDVQESAEALRFSAYDPNSPTQPTTLSFNRARRTFTFPTAPYFVGGEVDVYEVYHAWNY
jgi:hypothetical protein